MLRRFLGSIPQYHQKCGQRTGLARRTASAAMRRRDDERSSLPNTTIASNQNKNLGRKHLTISAQSEVLSDEAAM